MWSQRSLEEAGHRATRCVSICASVPYPQRPARPRPSSPNSSPPFLAAAAPLLHFVPPLQKKRASGDDGSSDRCPISDRIYKDGEFWIACDRCDKWYFGKAVNMDEKRAERQKTWVCPFCGRKKAR